MAKAKGIVKWFNSEKGFGFITIENGDDILAHFSEIVCDGFKTLDEGEEVEFELTYGARGFEAQNIVRMRNMVEEDDSFLGRKIDKEDDYLRADDLRKIALNADTKNAVSFWKEFNSALFAKMRLRAEDGERSYTVHENEDDMNVYSWLTKPHMYNKVIEELQILGYNAKHTDAKTGAYLTISWWD